MTNMGPPAIGIRKKDYIPEQPAIRTLKPIDFGLNSPQTP